MLKAGTQADEVEGLAKALTRQHGGRLIAVMKHAMKGFGVYMPEGQARALSNHPRVELVEEDEQVELSDWQNEPFDFERFKNIQPAKPEKKSPLLNPETLANLCNWNSGGYYVCGYSDDSYWHLDRLDNQGQIYGTKAYAYNSTGLGVRAYVVDFGVYGNHSEFDTRVEAGANMTVDPDMADTPLPGEEAAGAMDYAAANNPCGGWVAANTNPGHGTGVASVLGGTTVGVAKDVTIVPVKVITCGGYRSKMVVARGLDWIQADMAGRTNRGLVTMSTFVDTFYEGADQCEDGQGGLTNCVSAIEHEVNNLIGQNIPVIVSANNRNDGECRTSPARMGYGNETNHPSTHRTITVGGTMYVQNGTTYTDQQWTCAASPEGCDSNWTSSNGYGTGSNFGPCVSIWAPAWNMLVADGAGANSFRTRYNTATGTGTSGPSSGTSWSAPYTAGVVARLLERYPTLTPAQIWTALVTRANQRYCCLVPDLDPSGVTNTRLVYMSPFE